MKLCVIGTGYVGLVGAAIFSDWGNEVIGVDIDSAKIEKIKAGEMPIYEPGLAEIVVRNIGEKRLSFTTDMAEGIAHAEIVFICVGTPQDDTGAADLSAVLAVAKQIGESLTDYKVIVTKSTVPVGTNERVYELIRQNLKSPVEFDVASNPEFLREGSSVEDMRTTDRTVIGSNSPKALGILKNLYTHLGTPIVECDLRSAELIKYASNAFLATKISFINEIAQICERAHADISTVAKGMGLDSRIGPKFLRAGIGYGGSCFPKDVAALYRTSTDQAYDFKLLRGVMEVNERMKYNFLKNVTLHLGKNLSGKSLGVLGLAFKGDTDDIRDSVAIEVVKVLRGMGAKLKVYDPQAMYNSKRVLGEDNISYCLDSYEVMEKSDALFILTDWKEFGTIDLSRTKNLLANPLIFDGRNMLNVEKVQNMGFVYFAVGKRTNGVELLAEKDKVYQKAVLNNDH